MPGASACTRLAGGPPSAPGATTPQGGNKDRARQLLAKAVFPPEGKPVELSATFSGELVRGYWSDPGAVRWHAATVADLDNRVVLGTGAQVWYGATWIHADRDSQVDFQLQGHQQTYLVFELNGERIQDGRFARTTAAASLPSP
jgi:hypothetical protein